MIDTHCHINMNKEKKQSNILDSFFNDGGESLILIGTNLKTINEVIDTAQENKNIYLAIGIHPEDIENLDLKETLEQLEKIYLKNKNKIVAVGEIGLDYYRIDRDAEKLEKQKKLKNKSEYIKKRKELQAIFFKAQILLAKTYNIPFIIHNREAKEDVLDILKQENYKNFVFHCWSEDYSFAKKVLEFAPNSMISFSGIVTFKNASKVQETAKNIPEQNILAETDCPFLTPTPFRGKEENEPKYTKYVIEKISDLRGKDMKEIILENSKKFFGI